ncbi:MAG: sugar phosphate isomerase/epimerase family protein [Acidimicrobiales bacterium]
MAYAPPLGITASTLGSPPLRELVEAMVKADLRVLSFWPPATYQSARADGWSDRDMRALFDDNGIVVHDADALVAWVGPDDPGSPYFEETTPDRVFAAAEAMGARFVNAILTGRRANVTVDGAAEVLAGVCDQAAEHGVGVTVEFATRSAVNDIATACAVIERSGRTNVGICMDTWAYHFGTCGLDALVEAVPRIFTLQLDDGPAERPEDFGHATRYHRLVPGDGAIDYAGIFGALAAGNNTAPVILEVFNDEQLARHGVEGFARLLGDATRAVIAATR